MSRARTTGTEKQDMEKLHSFSGFRALTGVSSLTSGRFCERLAATTEQDRRTKKKDSQRQLEALQPAVPPSL